MKFPMKFPMKIAVPGFRKVDYDDAHKKGKSFLPGTNLSPKEPATSARVPQRLTKNMV